MMPRMPKLGIAPQIVAVLLVVGLVAAMGVEPTRRLIAQRERIEGMSDELHDIRRANARLEDRIARLNDPDYLEQQAREQIGLIRPGERVFRVVPPGESKSEAKNSKKAESKPPPPPEPGFFESLLNFIGI